MGNRSLPRLNSRRRELLVLSTALLAGLVVLVSCAGVGSGFQVFVTPTLPPPTPTPIPPIPHKTIVFCDDETGSYSPGNFHAAARAVSNWVNGLVTSNESGATVYVQWINTNSYTDSSTYLTFDVPAVMAAPEPLTPIPTAPSLERNEKNTRIAEVTETATAYAKGQVAFNAQYSQAQKTVSAYAAKVRQIPYYFAGSSDIWGCLQRASERLAESSDAIKYLVIASDMDPVGEQERASVNLHGVKVVVIFFQTSDVGSYNSRVNYWTSAITHAGASKPEFFRPGDQLPQQLF